MTSASTVWPGLGQVGPASNDPLAAMLTAPTQVKICCIASVDEARCAQAAGAAALGLVSQMPSGPGVVDGAVIAQVAAPMRGQELRTFLLTARTTAPAIAAQHAQAGTTTLQLVDHVPVPQLQRLRHLCPGVELVRVIHVLDETSIAGALAVAPFVDALLLDSGNPGLALKELGGTGRTHNWALSRRIRDAVYPQPLWLAAGLRRHNVAQAIAAERPFGLDLCSGVRRRGTLDTEELSAFKAAVRSAAYFASWAVTAPYLRVLWRLTLPASFAALLDIWLHVFLRAMTMLSALIQTGSQEVSVPESQR